MPETTQQRRAVSKAMPEKQSVYEKCKQAAIKAWVATTIVVAIFGFILMLIEKNQSHSSTAGTPGTMFMVMSPVVGILGAIIGAVSKIESSVDRPPDDDE